MNRLAFLAFLALPASLEAAEPTQAAVFTAGEEGYHTYRIPSVIVTAKGTVLAFCEGRKAGRGDAGKPAGRSPQRPSAEADGNRAPRQGEGREINGNRAPQGRTEVDGNRASPTRRPEVDGNRAPANRRPEGGGNRSGQGQQPRSAPRAALFSAKPGSGGR